MRIRGLSAIRVIAACALLLSAASCSPDRQDSVIAPDFEMRAATISGYTIIEEPKLPGGDLVVSQVLNILGGTLSIGGHSITVPKNAISVPTLFTLRVENDGYVSVELQALAGGLLGGILDLGILGFNKPVSVTLSYARATNVGNPQNLKILRDNANGPDEVLPSTVNTTKKTVTAKLEHFSRYVMICD